eukprot:CAMPEP_0194082802 /NCGR_PEP_ID=MMETSP0149-20130528/8220_1 /TAXON_ID=122233 /ORGANISM="Chaetoceros debilis, Strain MM31A-1" /LENGTH=106 /DNA_ID=CAMNT_0038765051 /DNA_START=93 /DNA_END=413 /DNA_ORIENTATION=+
MNNPITAWIKDNMETYSGREEWMKDRVAETSIAAQKIVDERHGPFKTKLNVTTTRRSRGFDHFYLASSDFKRKDEGCVNSFKSFRYYQDQSAKYRDELLKEVEESS